MRAGILVLLIGLGLPWKESLDQVEQLGLEPEAKRKLLRDNAVELFRL